MAEIWVKIDALLPLGALNESDVDSAYQSTFPQQPDSCLFSVVNNLASVSLKHAAAISVRVFSLNMFAMHEEEHIVPVDQLRSFLFAVDSNWLLILVCHVAMRMGRRSRGLMINLPNPKNP